MFSQVAQMVAIPSIASGTNTLVLTPIGNAPSLSNYQNFSSFRFVATATSSASVSAGYQALSLLPVYFSDGATQIGSGAIVTSQEYVLVFVQSLNSGAGGFIIESAAIPASASIGGGAINNLVITNGATPGTQSAVSYDALDMFNPAGQVQHATSQSFTINTANVGVINGIDVGALGASTWYAIWGIGNGSIAGGLVSASFTAPTMPSGLTYKKRIGAMFTSGASVFTRTIQKGRRAQYVVSAAVTTIVPVISSGIVGTASATSPTYATASVAGFVPPTASEIFVLATMTYQAGGAGIMEWAPTTLYGGTNNGASGSVGMIKPIYFNNTGGTQNGNFNMLLEATTVAGATAAAGDAIACHGWIDNL